MGQLDREAAFVERRQEGLDVGQACGAARAALLEDTPGPRVPEHHQARRHRLLAEVCLPVDLWDGRSI